MGKKAPSHPSEDRSERFALDSLLRKHGWRVVKRPRRGEALWEKNGTRLPASRALDRLPKDEVADAQLVQDIYFDMEYE